MDNNTLQIKIKQRLNKLASQDYDNISCWEIAEAFNKAQLEFVRKCKNGYNQRKTGDEGSSMSIDDIQILLTPYSIPMTQDDRYYESTGTLPTNYLYFKSIQANIVTECCDPRPLKIYLGEMANVEDYLKDELRKPSIVWGETFATLSTNKMRIYTNGEFEIDTPVLTYYRKPNMVAFLGCVDIATGTAITTAVECEFKDDVVELIIEDACAILAGDIESFNQMTRAKQNSINNN